jgi:hypothetical protein
VAKPKSDAATIFIEKSHPGGLKGALQLGPGVI